MLGLGILLYQIYTKEVKRFILPALMLQEFLHILL